MSYDFPPPKQKNNYNLLEVYATLFISALNLLFLGDTNRMIAEVGGCRT